MKRTLFFIACVLASLTMSAQEELTVEDLQNSGCLARTRGEEYVEPTPTIVLTKEGSILSVQILNYESQCATAGFNVKNSISEGTNGIPSLTINVFPYDNGLDADCICPFNVSFKIRDLETNTFYLNCWWYEGLVTLEEGEPLVLEDITLYATIDGLNYTLKKTLGTATLTEVVEQKSKMLIPSEIKYEGQTYTVKSIYYAFVNCTTIKILDIPESVSTILGYSFVGCKLDTLIIRGIHNPRYLNNDFFSGMGTDTKLYVQPSEVEKYKAIYKGRVYPLPEAQDNYDYIPFVKEGKAWNVFRSDFETGCHLEQYMLMNEGIVKEGKTYMKMYRSEDDKDVIYDTGLFREEDRKVYIFDAERQEEHLMFDYSLKEGDTFETYSNDEQRMVTYRVLSVSDYQEGPEVIRYDSDNNQETRRYLKKWTVCRTDNELLQKTWIEGVGSLEGPLGNLHDVVLPDMCWDYLGYVDHIYGDIYLPFSFHDTWNRLVYGCDLPTGTSDNWEDYHHQLTYELEGDRLHIYGEVFTNCGPNDYAYFYEKPTDDPLVHKIEFEIQEVKPTMDCAALHATDFYVSGFDPNLNYIIVDNQGEEHPVINKAQENNTDSDYLPLLEEGKSWHMVVSKGDECKTSEYMLMNGEVEKNGKTYFSLYYKDGEVVHDLGLLREEDRKVYFLAPYMQEEFLLFDYSLKEGDTFETYSYDEQKMVSYKVVSVGDCVAGPEIVSYDEAADSMIIHRRYLRQWTLCRTDNEFLQKTWVEGIGSFGGPIDNLYDASPISTAVYLAYVDDSDGGLYLPFSFHDTLWKQASGCDLPEGEAGHSEYDGHHHLTYELEGDRLHVYGEVYTQCGPNNYAYFIISPETLLYEELYGDPSIRKYNFVIQEVQPTMDCMALRSTDFYVSGFDPDLNYIIVDNQGEEHQVINKIAQIAYRPMIEDDKVWKVGAEGSGNPVQWVEYYYFDGDTIIDGRTCKQMMRQRYVSTDFPEYDFYSQQPSLDYVGAWYEEDKRVYEYDTTSQKFKLMYDFSLWTNAYWHFDDKIYMVGPRQTGGVKGFKGVYRDVWKYSNNEFYVRSTPWLEGVGGLLGPTINVFDSELADPMWFLMSCTVGDEVIYLNDEYEDGATPEAMNARKRLDFTHTIKTKPKAPRKEGTSLQLYGEYNNLQLSINLEPLDEAYTVRITDESDKVFYEKSINAGNIVGLNIDISAFTGGLYTVTVENSHESFTGVFEAETTEIREVRGNTEETSGSIYNLQGQRVSTLQKGLNIVNGQKVYVK